MITADSTLEDVAFAVSVALEENGIGAVLTGGSAAALYEPQMYMSYDADFVLEGDEPLHRVADALRAIGFVRDGASRIFVHSASKFTVDFPKGPLAVGGEYVRRTALLERCGKRLRILTRSDCVRDRLSHYYFWNDYPALNAAAAVAAPLGDKEMQDVRAWTERESPALLEKFAEFERRRSQVAKKNGGR